MSQLFLALGVAAAAAGRLCAVTYSLEEFNRTYALESRGRIAIENPNGDVRITAWDRDEVKVEAVKRAPSRAGLGDVRIVVDSTASALFIRTTYAAADAEEPASVEYRITVPRKARIEDVRLVNGALSISGLAGDVKATAVNGSIHAEDLAGQAELSTVNGRLDANFFRICDARSISLSSVNGPITLSLPSDARASVNARNLSGGIRSDYGRPRRSPDAAGRLLRTNIKGGGTRIRLHNVNGGILITGPVRRGEG